MGARYSFARSWGAELLPAGGARFRLWAPALDEVSLVGTKSKRAEPMRRLDHGWFELATDLVEAGAGYMFTLPNGMQVPDPAARAQWGDVHGPSLLIDPRLYDWATDNWSGRPWEEAVIYELHPGTYTEAGTFAGIEDKLDDLVELGVTVVELMPVAQFSGNRGWGYDGVLLYAPHVAYGGPAALKGLVDAAHARGLMVFLDVVYNHFGPDGNYLHTYAPDFFHPELHTPWGAAIAYDRAPVRTFLTENALYWLEEYRFDGLRLDAIDQIRDKSKPSIVEEIALEVRKRITDRHVHLTTEDDRNVNYLHKRAGASSPLYTGEWNDDFHHAAHVIATGESDGYYADYTINPVVKLARALTEGYVYQGEASAFRDGSKRGQPSTELPLTAFIDFLQNHDQAGNRACGERLASLAPAHVIDALIALLLLSPGIPLLFMGEEWGETRPFLFFTDFHGELGAKVREGRRNEFRKWRSFGDPSARDRIPDPNAMSTFEASKLDWNKPNAQPYADRLEHVDRLIEIRRSEIVPRLAGLGNEKGRVLVANDCGLVVQWTLGEGSELKAFANLRDGAWSIAALVPQQFRTRGRLLYETGEDCEAALQSGMLAPWSVMFRLVDGKTKRQPSP
jgi:maltooligosyltrehalose trehalohydrolase